MLCVRCLTWADDRAKYDCFELKLTWDAGFDLEYIEPVDDELRCLGTSWPTIEPGNICVLQEPC
ncbi:MAG: hypothetical protein COB90_04230 [Hyphomicrobiales bacterium]|nr:MAG: hypothetical protein COB90_04230 [Hyphomicrobiales bacterium]